VKVAQHVMAYMVDKGGVAPERLDTIGYGDTRPIVYEDAPGKVHSDAAKENMRVLFEVIVK
jgi:outer membrane protein OmpA-like peptidoglycan-associated protein